MVGNGFSGELWKLDTPDVAEEECNDYHMSICYLLCQPMMDKFLEGIESLDDEFEVDLNNIFT